MDLDCCIFRFGDSYKPSFASGILGGGHIQNIPVILILAKPMKSRSVGPPGICLQRSSRKKTATTFSARFFVLAMFGAFIFSGAALEDSGLRNMEMRYLDVPGS